MSVDIVVPCLLETRDQGTVRAWLRRVGNQVTRGEKLVELETDKTNLMHPSDVARLVAEIPVAEGQTVCARGLIARIGCPQELQ
jgi:pyruvate/2-oxoglutarate dehydrogenase complex dihydrolipoamide acyltransferase (E2) component